MLDTLGCWQQGLGGVNPVVDAIFVLVFDGKAINHDFKYLRDMLDTLTDVDNKCQKKYFHQILDGLHLVLVVDVREGFQHVPEVFKNPLNRFPIQN